MIMAWICCSMAALGSIAMLVSGLVVVGVVVCGGGAVEVGVVLSMTMKSSGSSPKRLSSSPGMLMSSSGHPGMVACCDGCGGVSW